MAFEYFGHEKIVETLSQGIPQVSLFQGPNSVGKWTLAEWLRRLHSVKPSDTLRIYKLTKENALKASQWASRTSEGGYRLALVQLSAKDTEVAVNTLLKALEDTPTRFILVSDSRPPETIRSRSQVFNFGLLSTEEVRDILISSKGFSAEVADDRAALSGGQVSEALKYSEYRDEKMIVLKALSAVSSRNLPQLEALAPRWDEEHTDLLVKWCYESLSGRWRIFMEEETAIRGTKIPLRILMMLREKVRPRLVVRAVLAGVI